MMNLILRTATMMVEIAVEQISILNFAQNVYANSRRHVLLDILDHWWVTGIVTMNTTIQTASMMGWTAVDLVLTQTSVLSAHVIVSVIPDEAAVFN